MATHDPRGADSHISFELLSDGYSVGFSPCTYSVALTIVDHRPTATADEFWSVMIPCPNSCNSAHHYRSFIKDLAFDLCTRCLNLHHCCAATLVPGLLQVVAAAHTCNRLHSVQLHVFPWTPADNPSIGAALRESFEAAVPKPTPASVEAIEKLVTECSSGSSDEDDGACTICLDDIHGTGESWGRMPCSHAFHRSCIVEWLKVSHVCPLCRYQMPVSAVSDRSH